MGDNLLECLSTIEQGFSEHATEKQRMESARRLGIHVLRLEQSVQLIDSKVNQLINARLDESGKPHDMHRELERLHALERIVMGTQNPIHKSEDREGLLGLRNTIKSYSRGALWMASLMLSAIIGIALAIDWIVRAVINIRVYMDQFGGPPS